MAVFSNAKFKRVTWAQSLRFGAILHLRKMEKERLHPLCRGNEPVRVFDLLNQAPFSRLQRVRLLTSLLLRLVSQAVLLPRFLLLPVILTPSAPTAVRDPLFTSGSLASPATAAEPTVIVLAVRWVLLVPATAAMGPTHPSWDKPVCV